MTYPICLVVPLVCKYSLIKTIIAKKPFFIWIENYTLPRDTFLIFYIQSNLPEICNMLGKYGSI